VNQRNLVLSGNLGLIYAPTDKWKIGVMASTGFRAPNIEDMTKVFESTPGTLIVPNDKIKPEKTLNAELNVTKFFGNSVRWENAIWATYFIDAIQAAPFQYNGLDTVNYGGTTSKVLANQNVGKAYLFGYSLPTALFIYVIFYFAVGRKQGKKNTVCAAVVNDQ
jgi:hemoglobin/transferrin/lactoferrin receptor protein